MKPAKNIPGQERKVYLEDGQIGQGTGTSLYLPENVVEAKSFSSP